MSDHKGQHSHGKTKGVNKTFGGKIIDALADFTDALEKGEVSKRFTCRQVKLNLQNQPYSPKLVKETRGVLGVSQSLFARFLGVSPKTVHAWEQGVNTPSAMACRFMDEIRRSPDHWRKRLRQVTVRCEGGDGVT
jgi:putative transcriptional regulator